MVDIPVPQSYPLPQSSHSSSSSSVSSSLSCLAALPSHGALVHGSTVLQPGSGRVRRFLGSEGARGEEGEVRVIATDKTNLLIRTLAGGKGKGGREKKGERGEGKRNREEVAADVEGRKRRKNNGKGADASSRDGASVQEIFSRGLQDESFQFSENTLKALTTENLKDILKVKGLQVRPRERKGDIISRILHCQMRG